MTGNEILYIALAIFIVAMIFTVTNCKCKNSRENYRDPLWISSHKLYGDYYSRANGSIYGTPRRGWDMLSGFPYYYKAY